MHGIRRPPRLRPGVRVGLVAPAGPMAEERIEAALAHCALLQLEPVLGSAVRRRHGFLAGTDDERRADLQAMLDRADVAAVWALRGGYGTMRLLHRLRPPPRPRAYIGFSDNTALHVWLLHAGFASFHGPHAGGELPPFSLDLFERVLFEPVPAGLLPMPEGAPPAVGNGAGRVEGELIGGNLALLAALCGTPWQPQAHGRILFIEDVGETGYRVDRLLQQLLLAGALEGLAGLALGQFTECGDPEEELAVQQVLQDFTADLGVPTVSGLPIGHVPNNWTLPVGVRARLDADAGSLALTEAAVLDA